MEKRYLFFCRTKLAYQLLSFFIFTTSSQILPPFFTFIFIFSVKNTTHHLLPFYAILHFINRFHWLNNSRKFEFRYINMRIFPLMMRLRIRRWFGLIFLEMRAHSKSNHFSISLLLMMYFILKCFLRMSGSFDSIFVSPADDEVNFEVSLFLHLN